MTAILDNLLFIMTLPLGFLIERIILTLSNPLNFAIIISSVGYSEYLVVRNILGKEDAVNFKTIFNFLNKYAHIYTSKNVSMDSTQWSVLDMILQKRKICIKEISDNTGGTIVSTKKMIKRLVQKGYIMRQLDINDSRALCYVSSDKFKVQDLFFCK